MDRNLKLVTQLVYTSNEHALNVKIPFKLLRPNLDADYCHQPSPATFRERCKNIDSRKPISISFQLHCHRLQNILNTGELEFV